MSKSEWTLQDLVRIDKHDGYYVNPLSGKITYRKSHQWGRVKFPTGVRGVPTLKDGKWTVTNIGKAKEAVETHLEKIRSGGSAQQAKRKLQGVKNPLISDIHDELIDIKSEGKQESTKTSYSVLWRHGIEPFWGTRTVNEFTPATIADYKKWYIKTHPERLFEKTNDHLMMLLRFALQRGYISKLPDVSELRDLDEIIRAKKKYKAPGRVYEDHEIEALLVVWPKFLGGRMAGTTNEIKTRRAALIRLGLVLGLRRGARVKEICAIRRDRIDFKKKTIELWSYKNHKWRDIPIDDELEEALRFAIDASTHIESEYLFPRPTNPSRFPSNQYFEKLWYKARSFAGLVPVRPQDMRFHDTRKTFATITAREGWPPKVACEILDMSLTVYEKVYASNVGIRAKAAAVSRTFGGKS